MRLSASTPQVQQDLPTPTLLRFPGTCRLGEALRIVGLIGLSYLLVVIVIDWQQIISSPALSLRTTLLAFGMHAVASLLVSAVGQGLIYLRHIANANALTAQHLIGR